MQVIHLIKTIKTGNAIYMHIPAEYLKALDIRRGDYLVMALYSGDTLLARKPTQQELFDLKPKDIQYGK